MRKAWLILVALLTTNYSVYAATPLPPSESTEPMILNESMLDSVTAGAISSTTLANAFAIDSSFAKTMTDITTYAIAREGSLQTEGKGVAIAQGNNLAFAGGSSISSSGTTGVSVEGMARAAGGKAYILVRTKAINTRNVDIAIGHVRSIACCGSNTYTSAQTSTFTQQGFNISLNTLREVNTPNLSLSIGNAIVVSFLHP